jgi:hypothetical protein
MKINVPELNGGKDISIEEVNVDAMEYMENVGKIREPTAKDLLIAMLISSSTIEISPDEPDYLETMKKWARCIRGEKLAIALTEFMNVNKSFLEKAKQMKPPTGGTSQA